MVMKLLPNTWFRNRKTISLDSLKNTFPTHATRVYLKVVLLASVELMFDEENKICKPPKITEFNNIIVYNINISINLQF